MTFDELVQRTQRGRVLRARRRGWRDPLRYVAVTVLTTHTGARVPGYVAREYFGRGWQPLVFATPTLADAGARDWDVFDGLHHQAVVQPV